MPQPEIIQTAAALADVFKGAPNVKAFDPEGPVGSGKHVIPGIIIGAGVAIYRDVFRAKTPPKSKRLAAANSLGFGALYESYDACVEQAPGADGVIDHCEKGYHDGSSFGVANIDSLDDVGTTVLFAVLTAGAVSKAINTFRSKFYEATPTE